MDAMEAIDGLVLPSTGRHVSGDVSRSSTTTARSTKHTGNASKTVGPEEVISWGRRQHSGSWIHVLVCATIFFTTPLFVIFYWIALSSFEGSLSGALKSMLESGAWGFFYVYGPRPSYEAATGYVGWVIFQVILYQFLPGDINTGQLTPAGFLLKYKTNGLLAWVVSHVLFVAGSAVGILDPAAIAKNWEGLLIAANICGFLLTGFAYAKAHLFPTHEADRKFSGSILYDMFMGIELNPRIGDYFDFKLFTNGRPGIVAWTLIDLSFMAYQYQLYGYITKSIVVSTILHAIYVVDFFVNEDWYLRTIDICHDHFGFYLAWGSFVWLPTMYTLQTQYLATHPVVISTFQAVFILGAGVTGYIIFRSVNHQKDIARRTKGDCVLWGSRAKVIHVKYRTTDGIEHDSMLLCSGWWGLARHVNYLGDLIISYSMCASCGFQNLLPWTYGIYMTILLVHRCWRDEERCSMKYGKGWDEYCKKVPWVIVPGIY